MSCLGDLSGATDQAMRIVAASPSNADGRVPLSFPYRVACKPRRALTEAETAVSLAPSWYETHLQVASVLLRLRRFRQARKAALRAIALDPVAARPLAVAVEVELAIGRRRRAEAYLRQALVLHPRDPDLLRLGLARLVRRDHLRVIEAIELQRQAIAIDAAAVKASDVVATTPARRPHPVGRGLEFRRRRRADLPAEVHAALADVENRLRRSKGACALGFGDGLGIWVLLVVPTFWILDPALHSNPVMPLISVVAWICTPTTIRRGFALDRAVSNA